MVEAYFKTASCIVCDRALFNAFPGPKVAQPWGGVAFTTRGNYGSQVYDGGSVLQIHVCDTCFKSAAKRSLVLVHTEQPIPQPEVAVWKPECPLCG